MLLAVDGNALAHRAWHSAGAGDAPPGEPARRLLRMLARVATAARPTACVVGFDDPASSRRRASWPGYKSSRPPKPAGLVGFLDSLPELLDSLGLAVVVPAGLEADDVLGSAALAASRRGGAATLATGDRDAFALVSPTVQVWWIRGGGQVERVCPSWLRTHYGVPPAVYPAMAALRGDPSDCLPGIRGLGRVTAAKLLAAYPDPAAALADPDGVARLVGPRAAAALAADWPVYLRNRELMAIRSDVPLDLEACARPLSPATLGQALASHDLADLGDRLHQALALLGRASFRPAAPTG
jgi:DNA polymerase-1